MLQYSSPVQATFRYVVHLRTVANTCKNLATIHNISRTIFGYDMHVWIGKKMIAVLPVIDPARCVTDPARFCRLAELRRLESSDDCLDKWRPSPRPWWKRPRASTSWSDLRCKDEVILVCMPLLFVLLPPATPVLPMFGIPWWSICKKGKEN